MSFAPTPFRKYARGGFGGRAASHFRGLQALDSGSVQGAIHGLGQVGTVVFRSPGGFSNHQLSGVTRDSAGNPLGFCRVDLCQGNLIDATVISDALGNFLFEGCGSGPFFIVAYKQGAPDVAGTTLNTLQPVVV